MPSLYSRPYKPKLGALLRKCETAFGVGLVLLALVFAQNQYYKSRCEKFGEAAGRRAQWKTLRWCEVEAVNGGWTKVMRP